jgi:TPR repeat protein
MAEARKWLERAVAQGLQEARVDLAGLPAEPVPGVSTTGEKIARAASL